ncbi:cobalt-precorrin-6x reductase [Hyphomicrobium nitrativorans NL23]|uniref:Cobalt-precorrin-6x reductase n=1 Tax=Hyphomicrobium nitrativorans NL23 TaxID=1029756 RepID=V5SCF2_9HYPH|nr:cobalt-precorrin-6A reductase [Hyphomicrobium nitrativorans]AHB48203.1 cobalt-precorrin-6x reductase [Hyphomicrobium nitrativorans NL23]
MRVLILGGTTEAVACAERLGSDPRFHPILSLAGRTRNPRQQGGIAHRVGGFGGAEGLAAYLAEERIDAVLDATHPFAAQISANADKATRACGVALCTLVRPPWVAETGDRWIGAATIEAAANALGEEPRRVFLAVGRQGVGAFRHMTQHAYIIRAIEQPEADALPPDTTLVQARGPFALQDEIELLTSHQIDVVVSKNAGGAATYAKIEAARSLGLPVIMIERPDTAGQNFVASAAEAVDWLGGVHDGSRSERNV